MMDANDVDDEDRRNAEGGPAVPSVPPGPISADTPAPQTAVPEAATWQRAVVGLFIFSLFFSLYTARAFLLPVVIAALLSLLLLPFKRVLERLRLPAPLAAAFLAFGLAFLVGSTFYALAEPAASWLRTLPSVVSELEVKLRPLHETVSEVSEAAEKVQEKVSKIATAKDSSPAAPSGERPLLSNLLIGTQSALIQLALILFLVYFFLASSDVLLRNFIHALPRLRDKVKAMKIVETIQHEVSRYLATITLINIALGAAVAIAMKLLGMPNPLLWGAMTTAFNFIPYLGAVTTLTVVTGAAVLSFDEPSQILLVSGTFLTLTSLEGQIITPIVLGHRLSLNPLVVFLGIVWWGWLWGIPGALIAVPLLVAIKIVFDQIEGLSRFGAVMGR